MRASLVVNCQSALVAAALRRCCQAWTWRSSVALSPTRSGRSRPRALSSISAMFSHEPSLGVWQGSRMKLAGDDPEHVIIVPGGLLAPTAKAGLTTAIGGDEVGSNLAEKS